MTAFHGINVAAITPRRANGAPDDAAFGELIDFLCDAGVGGIAVLGSTGEFAAWGTEVRMRVASLAATRSRVPVLVGIGHATLDGAVALGRAACGAGAAGVLAMPPIFFRFDQSDLREYYLRLAEQLAGVPIYLYNIPFFTSELAAETAVVLLDTGLFAGIKDSSGRFEYFEMLRVQKGRRPCTVLVGNDVIFTRARAAGADGVVSGVACAVPELLLGIDAAIAACDTERAARLDARLQEFIAWLDRFPAPVGVRAAVAARGLPAGPLAVPLPTAKSQALDEFAAWFRRWLPAVQQECRVA